MQKQNQIAYTITLDYVAYFTYKNRMLSDVKQDIFFATRFPAALNICPLDTSFYNIVFTIVTVVYFLN